MSLLTSAEVKVIVQGHLSRARPNRRRRSGCIRIWVQSIRTVALFPQPGDIAIRRVCLFVGSFVR